METTAVLPSDWPLKITGDLVWQGADFDSEDLFTQHLSTDDVAEIDAAIKHFLGLGIARGLASPENFPLSKSLAKRLGRITDHVYNGKGFHRLRGLEPSRYTEEERVVAYAGITSHVADMRARNIDHIRDRSRAEPGEALNPLELSGKMTFHTDVDTGDILSMFVQSNPREGGEQYLASFSTIYNDLRESNPEVLRLLAENWYWERGYRPGPNMRAVRTFNRPLIGFENGKLQVNMASAYLGVHPSAPFPPESPQPTAEQRAALRSVQESAGRVSLRIEPQPGDILFVNNFAILHARSSFVDSVDDVWRQRYIMRLALHDSKKGWRSAPILQMKLDETFDVEGRFQGLYTGEEWASIPRMMRVREMGVTNNDDHD